MKKGKWKVRRVDEEKINGVFLFLHKEKIIVLLYLYHIWYKYCI
jgi:hypothetical protein